jgi:hypothetical protein
VREKHAPRRQRSGEAGGGAARRKSRLRRGAARRSPTRFCGGARGIFTTHGNGAGSVAGSGRPAGAVADGKLGDHGPAAPGPGDARSDRVGRSSNQRHRYSLVGRASGLDRTHDSDHGGRSRPRTLPPCGGGRLAHAHQRALPRDVKSLAGNLRRKPRHPPRRERPQAGSAVAHPVITLHRPVKWVWNG